MAKNAVPSGTGRRGPGWLQCPEHKRESPELRLESKQEPPPAGPVDPRRNQAFYAVSGKSLKCLGHRCIAQTFFN